jgi:hypothetical protein
MQITLHSQTNAPQVASCTFSLKSNPENQKSSPGALRPYEPVVVVGRGCTRRIRRTGRVSSCSPHRGVCRHPIGTDSDCLNVGRRRTRHLVRCHSTRATCRAGNRAEKIAARTIGGRCNASSVLVAFIHARLDGVGLSRPTVRRSVPRASEALATVNGVGGAARVRVVPAVVAWAKSLSRRSNRGGRRGGSSGAATIGWRSIA